LRGKAIGNVVNMADLEEDMVTFDHESLAKPLMGKISLYVSDLNPNLLNINEMKPAMSTKTAVHDSIKPILDTIAKRYSPIKSKCVFHYAAPIF
jgi:hypothetical protein